MLNLREPPAEDPAPSSAPEEDPRDAERVESVRRLLDSRRPPGLAGIRRFVLKPRPRLWKFGVGVWLWLAQIAAWFLLLLRWLGRGLGRVVKALRLAGFVGRRVQNLGARVGFWGRNWSRAEGRLGRFGAWCAGVGERSVKRGAAFASFTDGASDLTQRAARFMGDVLDDPAPAQVPEAAPGPKPADDRRTPAPARQPAARRETTSTTVDAPRREQPPASAPPAQSSFRSSSPPGPQPARAPTRAPGSPRKAPPAPEPAEPPPLPDDIPEYMQIELRGLRGTPRPLAENVQRLILQVTEARGWTRPAELAAWLGFTTNHLNRRYLAPMTKAGLLERRFPDRLTHPGQTYRATRPPAPDA